MAESDYLPIGEYGLVGDLHTVALIGTNGSIDFMCFPHFDSPTIFGALLDRHRGGHFRIAPVLEGALCRQMYLPDTNVLLTRFLSEQGVAELCDFMPLEEVGNAHNLVRRVKTVRGEIKYRIVCEPRFDYGRADHRVHVSEHSAVFASQGPDRTAVRLRSSVPFEVQNGALVAVFTLRAGEEASFVLEEAEPGEHSPAEHENYAPDYFDYTVEYWRRWVRRTTYRGRWREMVARSALVLKLLTSVRHGSMVAAPTFGLPEQIGGSRNWDYRYVWIRDASFTLYAFLRLGFLDEAADFFRWLEDRCWSCESAGGLQVVYSLDGRRSLDEHALSHWEGYRRSRPVRLGNEAHKQLQLDIYGELIDAVYLFDRYGEPVHHGLWRDLCRVLDWLGDHWMQPDHGIWEVRAEPKEFLHSRLMSWVAFDRAIRIAARRGFPAPLARWHNWRDCIYEDIHAHFWDSDQKAFVQHKGSTTLDAATLTMPLVRFVSPTDRRWLSAMDAIERNLVEDSLVYRYRNHGLEYEGVDGWEGTFSICSFWYVECLSRAGQLDRARLYFEKMLGYSNHLGLYAEQLGPRGEQLGNYPQALTHLGLISAAYDLDRRLTHREGQP